MIAIMQYDCVQVSNVQKPCSVLVNTKHWIDTRFEITEACTEKKKKTATRVNLKGTKS